MSNSTIENFMWYCKISVIRGPSLFVEVGHLGQNGMAWIYAVKSQSFLLIEDNTDSEKVDKLVE